MLPVGIAMMVLGYALMFSGVSNLITGGKGWGFFQSIGVKGTGNTGVHASNYINSINAPGDSGSTSGAASTGNQATPPVSGTFQA